MANGLQVFEEIAHECACQDNCYADTCQNVSFKICCTKKTCHAKTCHVQIFQDMEKNVPKTVKIVPVKLAFGDKVKKYAISHI